MKKTSAVLTWSGVLGAFGIALVGVPLLTITAYAQVIKDGPPRWFTPWIFPMMLIGFLLAAGSHAISGVAGKGADDHSTEPQIEAATKKAEAIQAEVIASKPAEPVVEVKPPR